MTRKVRRYIYGIATAALPLLVSYGIISQQDVSLWVALVGAAVVPALAWKKTQDDDAGGSGDDRAGRRGHIAGRHAATRNVSARADREEHTAASEPRDTPTPKRQGSGARDGTGAGQEE